MAYRTVTHSSDQSCAIPSAKVPRVKVERSRVKPTFLIFISLVGLVYSLDQGQTAHALIWAYFVASNALEIDLGEVR